MRIEVPGIGQVNRALEPVETEYDGKRQTIRAWIGQQRDYIRDHRRLANAGTETADIAILLILIRDFLVRAVRGEAGERVYQELQRIIRGKRDLNRPNYRKALTKAKYRWGAEAGAEAITRVVEFCGARLRWKWNEYFARADAGKDENFPDDPILKIDGIGLKLRDLALSSFSPHYAAFDLHLCRTVTRIGLLNHGFGLVDGESEMGNNPANPKHYRFLHRLFLNLAEEAGNGYTLADLDRLFWHFGKGLCGTRPECGRCPIGGICLTGAVSGN